MWTAQPQKPGPFLGVCLCSQDLEAAFPVSAQPTALTTLLPELTGAGLAPWSAPPPGGTLGLLNSAWAQAIYSPYLFLPGQRCGFLPSRVARNRGAGCLQLLVSGPCGAPSLSLRPPGKVCASPPRLPQEGSSPCLAAAELSCRSVLACRDFVFLQLVCKCAVLSGKAFLPALSSACSLLVLDTTKSFGN